MEIERIRHLGQMAFVARPRQPANAEHFAVCSIAPQFDGTVRLQLPEFRGADANGLADSLLETALSEAARLGGLFCQVILPADTTAERDESLALIQRHGFRHLADAVFYESPVGQITAAESTDPAISRKPILPNADGRLDREFSDVLQATYAESFDVPEVHAVRSAERALWGLFAAESPAVGWMYCVQGEPAGLWLAAESLEGGPLASGPSGSAQPPSWEVVYMGTVRRFRRQGLARCMLQDLDNAASVADVPRLFVAVDERNSPAQRLYTSAKMKPFARCDVWWKPLVR